MTTDVIPDEVAAVLHEIGQVHNAKEIRAVVEASAASLTTILETARDNGSLTKLRLAYPVEVWNFETAKLIEAGELAAVDAEWIPEPRR